MIVGIPREISPGERRVAATPRTVNRLRKMGFDVVIESGAGALAEHSDEAYQQETAEIVHDPAEVWRRADIVLKVHAPQHHPTLDAHEADLLREGSTLISFIWPAQNHELLERLAERHVSALAIDSIPRITRAQHVDALSAMANLAGYRAVVEAVHAYPRLMSGQITAAGKVAPAKVLVIGGGVAGLAAIGAARGLGAIVRAFDTRPEVKEQVESMGAEFLLLDFEEDGSGEGGYAKVMSREFIEAEMALFAKQAMEVDIIITTALIPGREAPKLITAGMVESMREGSVIVDLAALQGGNCTVTKPGELVHHAGVRIVGFTDLASRMAIQSSWLYASTLTNLLEDMGGNDEFRIDTEDEVVRGALVTHHGEITWPPPKPQPKATDQERPLPGEPEAAMSIDTAPAAKKSTRATGVIGLIVTAILLLLVGTVAPDDVLRQVTVFVLACVVGWQLVWNVTPALHTPLMSVTNAISGIIIIGGMMQISTGHTAITIIGALAIFLATINIAGGFLVTRRMLAMFSK